MLKKMDDWFVCSYDISRHLSVLFEYGFIVFVIQAQLVDNNSKNDSTYIRIVMDKKLTLIFFKVHSIYDVMVYVYSKNSTMITFFTMTLN